MKMFLSDTEKKNTIRELENNLNKYDKVILINGLDNKNLDLTELIIDYLEMKKVVIKILLLSSTISENDKQTYTVQKISKEDEQIIVSLYRIYEFSDRFFLIDNGNHNGNLFNYVEKGLLTLEEAIEAMIDF